MPWNLFQDRVPLSYLFNVGCDEYEYGPSTGVAASREAETVLRICSAVAGVYPGIGPGSSLDTHHAQTHWNIVRPSQLAASFRVIRTVDNRVS